MVCLLGFRKQESQLANSEKKKKTSLQVTVTYFGEGAASEGDVHAAMNMAAVLKCPTLFICR